MNEAEWINSVEPTPMLRYLRGKASNRKLRLFAVACCHRIWNYLADERSRNAVQIAEAYADGLVDWEGLVVARDQAREAKRTSICNSAIHRAANAAFDVTRDTGNSAANNAPSEAARTLNFEDHNHFNEAERLQQTNLLRCIFGNPYRPVTFDPNWLTPDVVTLAQDIYDARTFDRMPSLGAALAEAGCNNSEIVAHCRSQGWHVRGCWVIDAVLGKSSTAELTELA